MNISYQSSLMMLFSDIEPFLQVAELNSFRAAARRLGLTPPAISKAIGRLERRLGAPLFLRTTRRVTLTGEGAAFLLRCQAAAREMEAGFGEIAESQQAVSGEVSLTAPRILGPPLAEKLPRQLEEFPDLSLRIELTDRRVDLAAERIDVAIRVGEPGEAGLIVRRLARLRWVMVAAPAYLARHGTPLSPDELVGHRRLAFLAPGGATTPWHLTANAKPLEVNPPPTVSVNDGRFLVEAAIDGAGIAQVFSYMAEPAIAAGRLTRLLEAHQAAGPLVNAVTARHSAARARVRVLLDGLYRSFADF